jgi:23S rRNA pseudouridine2605 synthase
MPQIAEIRLQKAIADRGLASRRTAEQWIREGRVTLNGEIAILGSRCRPGKDRITVDGNPLPVETPRKRVLAMNKPKGILCTNKDPQAKGRTVFDLLPEDLREERLFCVGRLDKESEGLLILTNDGALQQKLAHPSHGVFKKYHVQLDHPLKEKDIPKLIRGIEWEGEHLSISKVFPLGKGTHQSWSSLEVTMNHGRKREIRRLFYAFGYEVKRLQRTQIGQFRLKAIPRGGFKELRSAEIRSFFAPDGPVRN